MTTTKRRKVNRASFGSVRQLKSGRWQARYPAEDGSAMTGPQTFDTAADSWTHIAAVRADRSRGVYHDPRRGERLLSDYATEWIDNGGSRGRLAIRTSELYRDLVARHIAPTIGARPIGKVTRSAVRSWHTALVAEYRDRAAQPRRDGQTRKATGDARVRQAYALLRSILATAEGDGLVGRNPCAIKGAGVARSPERPFLSVVDFARIMEAHPEQMRPLLAAMFGAHLRLGEAVALRRGDLDLTAGTLRIERQAVDTRSGVVITATKSERARVLDLPAVTMEAMTDYLSTVPKALPSAPLFVREDGQPFTRRQVQGAFDRARQTVGLPEYHLHDVRHSGLTLGAQSGATLRELMARAGHSTSAAAMRYQHAAEERGKVIAAGMNDAMAGLSKQA